MVDPDIANALTIATIANVIEIGVIFFITFLPSLLSPSVSRHPRKRRIDQERVMGLPAPAWNFEMDRIARREWQLDR